VYGFCVPVNKTYEAIITQVALLLKEERQKQGISLNLLAEKAGLSRQAVAFVEQGLRTPSLETLLRMTDALKVEPEKIIAQARKRVKGR
jgi:transcriptional regulator with XRE-family HTH domain